MPHQIKVDAFADQRFAGAKKIFDRVQRLDDLRVQAGLFQHFAQGGLFRRFTFGDSTFGQAPSCFSACRDQCDMRDTVSRADDCTTR